MKLEKSVINKEYLEERIILFSDSTKDQDVTRCQTYLEQRKEILDKAIFAHIRKRDPELNSVWGTICTPHQFISTDGKFIECLLNSNMK